MADTPATCRWTYDDIDDAWDTACGDKFQFITGNLEENNFRFCHSCGGKIEVTPDEPAKEADDDDAS